jgi:hypothetical protein
MSEINKSLCHEPHPTLDGVLCDKKIHAYGSHSSKQHRADWAGIPAPVVTKSSKAKASEAVNTASPETRTGPPTGTMILEKTRDQFEDPDEGVRLGTQAQAVYSLMLDGNWRSLRDIAEDTGFPEASISARLRDLRKPEFGGLRVEHMNMGKGHWLYRLSTP